MDHSSYRALLPAPGKTPPSASDKEPKRTKQSTDTEKIQSIACNRCRLKKSACDGQRPRCGSCRRQNVECVFRPHRRTEDVATTLLRSDLEAAQRSLADHVEILERLKALPDGDARLALQRLRMMPDLTDVLHILRQPTDNITRLSDHATARAVLPPMLSGLEFELTAQYGSVYQNFNAIDKPSLLRLLEWANPTRREVNSLVWLSRSSAKTKSPLDTQEGSPKASPGLHGSMDDNLPSPEDDEFEPAEEENPSAGHLYDPRLETLRIGYWTKVPISEKAAAAAISSLLKLDNTIACFFGPDLFLEDLVHHRPRFCSSILVSSVLYFACQAFTAVDIRASALVPLFFREANMLWPAERNRDSINTVAAAHILALGCQLSCKDNQHKVFKHVGYEMATRLGLLGVPNHYPQVKALQGKPPVWIRAASHVAWGFYNYLSYKMTYHSTLTLSSEDKLTPISYHAFYYLDDPTAYPPSLPIPGDTSSQEMTTSDAYSPFSTSALHFGSLFSTQCRLFVVAQEVAAVYLTKDEAALPDRIPLAFAEEKYRKLLSLIADLEEDVVVIHDSSPHVILFHIWFHIIVLQIFVPFMQNPPGDRLGSFTSADSIPATVVAASVNQLKRIAVIYLSQPRRQALSSFINVGLIHVAYSMMMVKDFADENWRYYFLLCLRAWLELYVSYPTFGDIIRAFLSMALREGVMKVEEAQGLLEELRRKGEHHEMVGGGDQPATASFIVDFELAMTDPGAARVDTLAQRFEELALFDEFMNSDVGSFDQHSG